MRRFTLAVGVVLLALGMVVTGAGWIGYERCVSSPPCGGPGPVHCALAVACSPAAVVLGVALGLVGLFLAIVGASYPNRDEITAQVLERFSP